MKQLKVNEAYLGDNMELLPMIPDESIDLICIDPPYNIGKAEWDKIPNYIEWMGERFKEAERVLKTNGSLYFFHNDFNQLRKLMDWIDINTGFVFKRFIQWEKYQGNKQYFGRNVLMAINNSGLRNYFPMAEYCLFYVKQEKTLWDETGWKKITHDVNNFKSLRKYFEQLQGFIGGNKKELIEKIGQRVDHCFRWRSSQWSLPTEKTYDQLIEVFRIDLWDGFKRYEELRQEYEELRQEYEELRYTFNAIEKDVTTTWVYVPAKKIGHVTPKPVNLLERIISHSSNENDLCLDFFAGSGSFGVACQNLNRNFIVIEKDKGYFELIQKRLKENINLFNQAEN